MLFLMINRRTLLVKRDVPPIRLTNRGFQYMFVLGYFSGKLT